MRRAVVVLAILWNAALLVLGLAGVTQGTQSERPGLILLLLVAIAGAWSSLAQVRPSRLSELRDQILMAELRGRRQEDSGLLSRVWRSGRRRTLLAGGAVITMGMFAVLAFARKGEGVLLVLCALSLATLGALGWTDEITGLERSRKERELAERLRSLEADGGAGDGTVSEVSISSEMVTPKSSPWSPAIASAMAAAADPPASDTLTVGRTWAMLIIMAVMVGLIRNSMSAFSSGVGGAVGAAAACVPMAGIFMLVTKTILDFPLTFRTAYKAQFAGWALGFAPAYLVDALFGLSMLQPSLYVFVLVLSTTALPPVIWAGRRSTTGERLGLRRAYGALLVLAPVGFVVGFTWARLQAGDEQGFRSPVADARLAQLSAYAAPDPAGGGGAPVPRLQRASAPAATNDVALALPGPQWRSPDSRYGASFPKTPSPVTASMAGGTSHGFKLVAVGPDGPVQYVLHVMQADAATHRPPPAQVREILSVSARAFASSVGAQAGSLRTNDLVFGDIGPAIETVVVYREGGERLENRGLFVMDGTAMVRISVTFRAALPEERKNALGAFVRSLVIGDVRVTPQVAARGGNDLAVRAMAELARGERTRFTTAGHPKALGLDLAIEVPASWTRAEGLRPHIVQTFKTQDDGGTFAMVTLLVKEMPDYVSAQVDSLLSDSGLRDLVDDGAVLVGLGRTKLEGLPAGWVTSTTVLERAGVRIPVALYVLVLPYEGKWIQVQCMASSAAGEGSAELLRSFTPLCQLIANSVVLRDRWR